MSNAKRSNGGSWLSILANATLGAAARLVRARVTAQGLGSRDRYRLIVHSYEKTRGGVPCRAERPTASFQRTVTGAELKAGVRVELVETSARGGASPFLVAWVESGEANLEFDGRTAKPMRGSIYGLARGAVDDATTIHLNRSRAA